MACIASSTEFIATISSTTPSSIPATRTEKANGTRYVLSLGPFKADSQLQNFARIMKKN